MRSKKSYLKSIKNWTKRSKEHEEKIKIQLSKNVPDFNEVRRIKKEIINFKKLIEKAKNKIGRS